MDKAGKTYWENLWKESPTTDEINPFKQGLNGYTNREFHKLFKKHLPSGELHLTTLLEIGCAKSAWLPYFARTFGYAISGIDYSQKGCDLARETLNNSGLDGNIICSNFFSPPLELLDHFNVVISFGVAEHFEDTSECIQAFANFLKKGGIMITLVPNLVGFIGILQKILDKDVYNVHVPLDKIQLEQAHSSIGMEIIECEYFLPINLGILNIESVKNRNLYSIFMRLFSWISKSIWLLSEYLPLPSTKMFSPYVICIARKI